MSLLAEIHAKCSAELLATRDYNEIARIVSVDRKRAIAVPRAVFARWAAKSGLRAKIEDHASNAQSPLRSIALSLLDMLRGAAESLDLHNADNAAMLGAWVQSGNLTEADRDELLALGFEAAPVTPAQCANAIDGG